MPNALITPERMYQQPAPYVDMLREAGFEICYPKNLQFARGLCSTQETIEELRGMAAVIAGGEVFSAQVLAETPELRVIARAGVGFDRVDVPSATEHNIAVTITPTSNHRAVAEQAFALIFAVAKNVVVNDRRLRVGQGWPPGLTEPIRDKTLGVIGLGRIGRSTALLGKAVGMNVIAFDEFPQPEFARQHDVDPVDFDTLLARSDYVSIHCPLNEQTHGLFNAEVFAKMKPGSVLINTSRGGVVVERDLLAALESGHLRAAGLDVFEQEPPAADNPLFALDNVVVSPHLAGTDTRSMEDMGIEAAECIIKLSRNQWPQGAVVNDGLKSTWKW